MVTEKWRPIIISEIGVLQINAMSRERERWRLQPVRERHKAASVTAPGSIRLQILSTWAHPLPPMEVGLLWLNSAEIQKGRVQSGRVRPSQRTTPPVRARPSERRSCNKHQPPRRSRVPDPVPDLSGSSGSVPIRITSRPSFVSHPRQYPGLRDLVPIAASSTSSSAVAIHIRNRADGIAALEGRTIQQSRR